MPTHLDLSQDLFDTLAEHAIGRVDLADERVRDASNSMATANTCYRSCAHTLCLCVA